MKTVYLSGMHSEDCGVLRDSIFGIYLSLERAKSRAVSSILDTWEPRVWTGDDRWGWEMELDEITTLFVEPHTLDEEEK